MKKSLIVVAVASAVTVLFLHQQRRISQLQEALAEREATERTIEKVFVPAPTASRTPAREVGKNPKDAEIDELMNSVAPPAAASAPATAQPPPAQKTQSGMGDFFKSIGSMMTNPAMKEMVRAQSKMQLEMQYDRLFKFLNKTPEQIAALKDILMDRQMALMDSGMAFMTGNTTPEERKKKAEEIKMVKDSYDKKIADLLGPDDADAFKQYENTQPERMQAEMFKHTVASSGEPLTDQQEYDLVNAMYAARTNAPPSPMTQNKDEIPDPSQFTPANLEKMTESMNKMQEQYAATAQKILSPGQYQQFTKFMEQQKAMNEMGMKFAAQMFGGGSNAVGSPVAAPVIQVHVQTQ
jgi:hypothetical protein